MPQYLTLIMPAISLMTFLITFAVTLAVTSSRVNELQKDFDVFKLDVVRKERISEMQKDIDTLKIEVIRKEIFNVKMDNFQRQMDQLVTSHTASESKLDRILDSVRQQRSTDHHDRA